MHVPWFWHGLLAHGSAVVALTLAPSAAVHTSGTVADVNKRWREQVRVQPPSSAINVTLPVFAAERRRLLHGSRSYRSTERTCT